MATPADRRRALAKRRFEQLAHDDPGQRTIADMFARRSRPVVGRAVSSSEELMRAAFDEVEHRPSVAARVDVVGDTVSVNIVSTREDVGADDGVEMEMEEAEAADDEDVVVDGGEESCQEDEDVVGDEVELDYDEDGQ